MLQENAPLSRLSILNRNPKVIQGPKYLHHLVSQSPISDGPAVDFLEDGVARRSISYKELHEGSDVLAAKIRSHLARLENASHVVPVLLPQSPELYVTLLAILKAGRAFCPIGLDLPRERIDFILKDVGADLLITNTTYKDSLPASSDLSKLFIDNTGDLQSHTTLPEDCHFVQSHLAYVLYTSGSTGLPKAVSVSHRAVTQSLLAHDRHIPTFTRFLQFAAPTFDVSIFEIFFPLYRGCTLVGCTRSNMLNNLPALINSLSIDAAELTPTAVSNLLRGRRSVPGLKLLLTIGEMLTQDIIDEFGGNESQASVLWGMYGPTEAAIHCTVQPDFSCDSPPGSIGFPLETVTTMIAAPIPKGNSPQGVKILPIGEAGELVLGGPQVADEYLNRPEMTKTSFVDDEKFGRLYRTGDKARLRADGILECLGRIVTGQVKFRGQRIELGEIEQTIMKSGNCYSVVVMIIQDSLVAFCTPKTSELSMSIQETCRRWLPSYMVPTDVMLLDRMPQLASGKIDKKSLKTSYLDRRCRTKASPSMIDGKPTDILSSVFRDHLARDVADYDDFANIGIDSLRSIRIASSIRKQGFDIGPIDILSSTNIAELRKLCDQRKEQTNSTTNETNTSFNTLSHINELQDRKADIIDVLPCTPLQEAMLTETAVRPGAYCNWIEVELPSRFSFQQIQEQLIVIIQANEILRTGFCTATTSSDTFMQVIWRTMRSSMITEVANFSRSFTLGSVQSLLRPFTVQISMTSEYPRVLFQIHHALYDGWSFDLLMYDLSNLLDGHTVPPRPQFRQVAHYYAREVNVKNLEKSKDYWQRALHDFHPLTVPNFNGRTVSWSALQTIHDTSMIDITRLSTCASGQAVHPQVFYQAALVHVLSQYLGVSDTTIGTVTSGRTIPVTHIEEIMGPCIASLPFRMDMSTCSTVADLLQKTQRANRKMLEHCALPLRDITRLCQLRPGERPFDILFIWQESLVSAANRKLSIRTVESADDLEFKITFELEPREDTIAYRVTYDPSVIPDEQIRYLLQQVDHTVQYFLENQEQKLADAMIEFNQKLLSLANSQPVKYTFDHGPASSVEKWATEAPDKTAVVIGSHKDGALEIDKTLTYASLNARANQVARIIVQSGIGEDELVCVLMGKSIGLYVSILAILKTGSGYLPIVPGTPKERIRNILADAGVKICISDSNSVADIEHEGLTVLNYDALLLSNYPGDDVSIPYDGSHLAYAVFTSGSTGKPKGVLVTQDNLMSNLEYLASLYPYSEDSKLLQSCSQAFDVSVFEIFFSWHVGICLCTAEKDDLFYDFEAAIDKLGITHLSLTPTVAGLVDPTRVPTVKFLVTAGEALTERVRRKWTGRGLYQGYGPSETTNICTVNAAVTESHLINNIGPVFPNTSLVILDPGSDRIVPRGAIGELCFGGSQVFRGYLNRPDLNSQKIIAHPIAGRIYRSGDMGRLLPDDSILSTGRLDDQVKIRGQRVELGEITSIILDHSFVHDCATVLLENDNAHQQLVVYWVPQALSATKYHLLSINDFRSRILDIFDSLSVQLPAYMVPTHIIPISSIPMTHQAKVDKRKLHFEFNSLSQRDLELAAFGSEGPQNNVIMTETGHQIRGALSRALVLSLDVIKPRSSFFSLGLDSVSAIRFAKDLRNSGLGQVPVSLILKNPTIERLCSALGTKMPSKVPVSNNKTMMSNIFTSSEIDHIRTEFPSQDIIEKILPCTPLQEAMLSAGSTGNHSYYNVMAFTIHGDLERLRMCWEHMFVRHDILRTTFVSTNNVQHASAQVVLKRGAVIWDSINDSADISQYASKLLPKLLQERKPPVQLAICADGMSSQLIFCCHHALYDGVAVSNLLSEVQDLYNGRALPDPVSYDVFLRHVISQDKEAAYRFWAKRLSKFEPTYFPQLAVTKAGSSNQGNTAHRKLQTTLSEALEHCRISSTSLLSLVQAAWVKLAHFVLGETDICFGNVVSGRTLTEDDLERLVAPCFNTIPVRVAFDFQRSNAELCKELHTFNVDSLPFHLTPLRWIQSNIRRSQGHIFDTLVLLQQPDTPLDHSIWEANQDAGDMDLPIVCEVAQNVIKDHLMLKLYYHDNLCSQTDADTLTAIFDKALQSLISSPNSPAQDTVGFPDHLLGQRSQFEPFDPRHGAFLHSALELNAKEKPTKIALEFLRPQGVSSSLTFAALNEKANQIAHALLELNIQPDDVVPVYMPKSPEFYVSILGVLKAGGAFTPLHPDLPEARKRFMISELKPKVVLTLEPSTGWLGSYITLNITDTKDRPKSNPCIGTLRPTNLAYCLYTSGSTGVPKAVSMEHRSPIQTVESSRSLVPWNSDSRLLQYAAITFDMCYYDCFLAWTFGFTLCAADQEVMLNNLASSINELRTDLLDLTPSVAASLRRVEVPSVKWLYCIGESLTSEVITEWAGACVNSYGPTEAAFCTTMFPTSPGVKTSIIGKPFPSTSFAVFPPQGDRPVPVFGIGELYIGGAQLARGYHGRSQLTEEKFVHRCGQRFYKSGDIVRMLSDGSFEFLGRKDDQVKIRGLRVELGEINKVIQDFDDKITSVSTQILKKEANSKVQLVAFLQPRHAITEHEQRDLRSDIRQRAKDSLPSYMIPQFFIFVEKIPKSLAGKVDKNALRTIFLESEGLDSLAEDSEQDSSSHPWNERETLIRQVFAKLSNMPLEDIKPWTSIYQLGLDSISAVQIAAALRQTGPQVLAADVMKCMNCRDLAARLGQLPVVTPVNSAHFDFGEFERKHETTVIATSGISNEQIEAVRPCTPLQNGMLSQFVIKQGAVYLNYLRLRLRDGTDMHRLHQAWLKTVRKYPMLRTGFSHVNDNDTSFAMIHYTADAYDMAWENVNGHAESVEAWLHECEHEVVNSLHRPPWRARVHQDDSATYLDLALLHALFDAKSLRMIFDHVASSYNGVTSSAVSPLEPVIEKIIHLSDIENTGSREFWEQLGKSTVPTRFPNFSPLRYDPAPPEVTVRSSSRTLNELDNGCRASNISLQAAGLASWGNLLSSYVGEPSVTFGVVLSGRNFDDADTAVFPCITTVPFACQLSDDKERTLKDVMSLNAEIHQHQFTPLNEIQKLMGHSNETLFESIFAFQKVAIDDHKDDLWTVVDERATIEYPISIELEPKDGHLEFRLTYLPHVVPKEQALLILDQLDYLLERYIFTDIEPGYKPEMFSITPANTPVIPSEATLLHEFVELTSATSPDQIAFEFATSLQHDDYKSQQWTYSQLNEEGDRIANFLVSQGVRCGELVGICFDKCPEASFAILGILKAGCAYVALDPGAPSARKSFIIKDSGAHIVLSTSAQSADFKKSTTATILNLDEMDWRSFLSVKPTLNRQILPEDRSYCLYTSGTTGTPKGCELTHENAVQAMMAFKRLFAGHWDENSRWLQFASFHFDVSVLEQYWSWSVGICVVSAPRDVIFEDLAASIKTLGITHIDLTPSLARILHPDDVPSLCKGVFITGGESLRQDILDVWGPKSVIYNGYGPTEATIGVTMYPRVPANGKPSNIGPQFDNVGSYVLRPGSDVPVLRGGVGELCVSGKLVGKGYLNRLELTEERFAHLVRFDERVYRTGDLVRILFDGTFDFLGRADDQVKLRGQRLEIGEINTVIKQCGLAIADVATLVLRHPKQQKEQLVSFIVIESDAKRETEVVLEKTDELWKAKQAAQERLPPYMVPTHFVALNAMPLSPNNKVEAKKLKAMYENLSVADLQLLSTATEVKDEKWSKHEEDIRDTLMEVLNISGDFSRDISFFELGMDSISVLGVSKALKQVGFSKCTASVILKNATIRQLSKALLDKTMANDDCGAVMTAQQTITAVQHRHRLAVAEILFMDTRNIEALAPCTPLQQGMIARSLDSCRGLYFNSFHLVLRHNTDINRLLGALKSIFASTQVLRTAFINTDDGFVQAVVRNAQLTIDNVTLPSPDALQEYLEKKRVYWVHCNQVHIKRPLEMSICRTPECQWLIVRIFHGLYDGNSVNLVFKSVWNAYNDIAIADSPGFHSVLAYGPLRPTIDARSFWEKRLEDRHCGTLPALTNRSKDESTIVIRTVSLSNFDSVRRKLNVTAQAIAQACWVSVLNGYLKTSVTIGMIVSGRSIDFQDADQVIGPLFNTIPYQYRAQQRETWASRISRAHDFNIAAHQYQQTPLRDIMKWMKRTSEQPLFDSLFAYQLAEDDGATNNDLWELKESGAEADYPLAIEVEQGNGGLLKLTLVAQGHIADTERATKILERYEEALREAVKGPSSVSDAFPAYGEETVGEVVDGKADENAKVGQSATDFEWSRHATMIRREMAYLCEIEEEEIQAHTSILELGLDSIDAIKLSSKLKKEGIHLSVSRIMQSLTIANMVRYVAVGKAKQSERPSDMIYRANKKRLESYLRRHGLTEDVEQVLPLTPLQEAMVAEMIASDYTRYYNHDVLELSSDVDTERLKQAWTEVIRRSPILRTSFVHVDDPSIDFSHVQTVQHEPHDFWKIETLDHEPDFSTIFESTRKEAVINNLSKPLCSVLLIQSPQQAYMVLSISHALYDGWSLGLLHSDVHQAYEGNLQPRPNYEHTLQEILTTSGSDAAAFWRHYLTDANPAAFLRRANTVDNFQIVHRKQQSSRISTDNVVSFAKRQNITLQTLGQAVHGLTMASYTKSFDVTFGSVLSGRDDESRSRLLFPTMNTVAVRTILHGSRRGMLQYVQENFLQMKQWQHFPLRKALSLAGAQGNLLESLFIYQRSITSGSHETKKLYESIQGQSDVEYPVCVEMEIVDKQLVWRCAVKEEVFGEEGTQELLDRLDDILKAIISQPDAPVVDFTEDGTSICGLPAFTNKIVEATEGEDKDDGLHQISHLDSPTAKLIREVLAFVSKTPEGEIVSGMTIFHMGLDSISAIKVASLLRKRGITLSVGEMLKAGTIEEMARIVDQRAPLKEETHEDIDKIIAGALSGINPNSLLDEAGIKQEDVEVIFPTTAGQTYMLSMWVNTNGAVFYPEFTYRVHGSVSFEKLQTAWEKLVARHPILRTSFYATNDERVPYLQAVMRTHDHNSITNSSGAGHEISSDTRTSVGTQQPFAHMTVAQLSDGWDLRLKIHHALYDGVSLPLIVQELQDFGDSGGEANLSLEVLKRLSAATLTQAIVEQRTSFWEAYLKDMDQSVLPQPPGPPTAKTEVFKPALLPSVTGLEAEAHKRGLTTQSLFLATYARLYVRLTSTPATKDIIIGIYLANRSLPVPNLDRAAIPTVNLLPLRVSTPLETNVYELAAQIQYDIQEISALANASASLWEIFEITGIKVDTFVNFLKLPDVVDAAVSDEDERVAIVPAGKWSEGVSRIIETEDAVVAPSKALRSRVNEACLHALDIEATIRSGALDVGVFAPMTMLNLEQAKKLIESIQEELMGIGKVA